MASVNVNGRLHNVNVPDDTPLLWALRDELGLTGTKFGCGMALCGACTVHVDGQPVRACMTPVSAVRGAKVTTIEAIGADPVGRAVQATFPAELSEQVEVLQRCAELTAAAMPRLQSMQSLDDYWIEINRLENTGDRNHRRILAALFSGEFKTIEVLKLKDIVESLEGAIDAFEKVANTVEQIAVKEG